MVNKLVFGAKPPQEKVVVRVQQIGPDGHPTETQSMTVWDAQIEHVVRNIANVLAEAYGIDDAPEADVPVEAPPAPKKRKRTS
jgi:hypothetical protein